MKVDWQLLVWILGAYLLGSVPFGLLVSKLGAFEDPRTVGSGNIGFTNVLRVSGKKAGILTLAGDGGKGVLVGYLAQKFVPQETSVLLISFAVILGHIFSVFLKFKGGKGVATALGSILGLEFFLGLALLMIWGLTAWIFRYSSGGALVSFGVFPVLVLALSYSREFVVFALCVSVIIIYRHKGNISRLLHGTESKIGRLFS